MRQPCIFLVFCVKVGLAPEVDSFLLFLRSSLSRQWCVLAGFAGSPHVVLRSLLLSSSPKARYVASVRPHFRQWHVQGWYCWVFRLVMCSLLLTAGPDARHHGRHGPEGQLCHLHEDRGRLPLFFSVIGSVIAFHVQEYIRYFLGLRLVVVTV